MGHVVVVNEPGNCVVMATSQHTRRSLFFGELLLVCWLAGGVWRITADHFLVLAHPNALTLGDLDVFKTGENLMLDHEIRLHLVLATLLDGERFLLQALKSARL